MGEEYNKHSVNDSKPEKRPYLALADDELKITHGSESRIHRLVFHQKNEEFDISNKSSIFHKIKAQIQNWNELMPMNFWKNICYTLGLSRYGRMIIYVKSALSVFPKEFLRSLRQDFKFNDHEIEYLINSLTIAELEIAHKINDPKGHLKGAKVVLKDLINKLVAFTDESQGSLELELRGDPATSGNLEYLLRDKLNAILYFAELTKIIARLTFIQEDLKESLDFIANGLVFLIDNKIEKIDEQLNETLNKMRL